MKTFMYITSLLLAACSSVPSNSRVKFITYQFHPQYGEVALPNELYQKDLNACSLEVLQQKVNVGGEVKTNGELLKNEYQQAQIDAYRRAASGRPHCVSTISDNARKLNLVEILAGVELCPKISDGYKTVTRVATETVQCVTKKGWINTRTEKIYVPRENVLPNKG